MCKDNMLDGFMEVPECVGKLLQDPHFTVLVNAHVPAADNERREAAHDILDTLVARALLLKAADQR